MADKVDPATRSRIMSAVKSFDTKPEMKTRRFLHANGFRFRLHRKDLPGRPDIVLAKYRTAIFVHGCFWHMHGCRESLHPKSRSEWWKTKLEGNKARDERNLALMKGLGWNVIVLWECQITVDSLLELKTRITSPHSIQFPDEPLFEPP